MLTEPIKWIFSFGDRSPAEPGTQDDTQGDTLLMAIASRSGRERRTLAQAKQYIGTNEGLARYLAEERASK